MIKPDPQIILEALKQLNLLENKLDNAKGESHASLEKHIEKERTRIPKPILSHHDRIRAKSRASVAPVRASASTSKWLCGNCHIEVPRGMYGRLQVVTDITVCENCGVYLYLEKEKVSATA
ncbi:MAG: hypothetical protein V1746_08260 [bacterium]